MKVIHFIASIDKSWGGTSSYIQLLAEELRHYSEVKIATINSENPVEIPNVEVVYFELSLLNLSNFSQKVKVFLMAEKPDLVHLNGIWNPEIWFFQKEAQKLGIQVVLSPHGMLEPYILKRNRLKKKLAMFLYQHKSIKRADYIHATAKSELDNIKDIGYQNKSFIVPNGIIIENVTPKEVSDGVVKHFLFLSRVHPKKGIDVLIEAVAEIKHENIKITIAGNCEDGYVNELRQLAKNKKVSQFFNFVGPVYGEEKNSLYKSADFFVLPTHSENFGMVIAEALVTGVPVITTKNTPWEDLVIYKCGWWIDLSISNLKDCLEEAINTNVDMIRTMGINGQQLVKDKYDIKEVAKNMFSFYEKIYKNQIYKKI